MEIPSTSECPSPGGGDDVRESVRHGIRLDVKWRHQRIHRIKPGRGPAQTRRSSFGNTVVFLIPMTTENPLVGKRRQGTDLPS